MKQFILASLLFIGATFAYSGNGHEDPPCGCNTSDRTEIYAAGLATLEGGNQVKCSGEGGTCWEVVYLPSGGWKLTIYTEPPLSFGNNNSQTNPPPVPAVVTTERGYTIYQWNDDVWTKK
jgi:hypothetical protein